MFSCGLPGLIGTESTNDDTQPGWFLPSVFNTVFALNGIGLNLPKTLTDWAAAKVGGGPGIQVGGILWLVLGGEEVGCFWGRLIILWVIMRGRRRKVICSHTGEISNMIGKHGIGGVLGKKYFYLHEIFLVPHVLTSIPYTLLFIYRVQHLK